MIGADMPGLDTSEPVSKENAVRWRLLTGFQQNTVRVTVDLGGITLDDALTLLAERYDGDAWKLYLDIVPVRDMPVEKRQGQHYRKP